MGQNRLPGHGEEGREHGTPVLVPLDAHQEDRRLSEAQKREAGSQGPYPASQVQQAAEYTALKDAPVVAAALAAQADYLTTWDRKHLIEEPLVALRSGLEIVTPDKLVELLGL